MTEPAIGTMTVGEAADLAARVVAEVERAVVGKREALLQVLAAVLAKGHVLLEDYPGLGKTLAARSFAQALGRTFGARSSLPTCCPPILLGRSSTTSASPAFTSGPVRSSPGCCSPTISTGPRPRPSPLFVEAMQERQVTVEGESSRSSRLSTCSRPRTRSSTRAPTHFRRHSCTGSAAGQLRLPVARGGVRRARASPGAAAGGDRARAVTHSGGLLAMQAAVETVTVDESVARYCVDLATATRTHADVLTGASLRGSLGLGWPPGRSR